MKLFDLEAIRRFLVEVAQHHSKRRSGRPQLARRSLRALGRLARAITLDKLRTAEWLQDGDGWVTATLAGQTVARLLERQGRSRGGERP